MLQNKIKEFVLDAKVKALCAISSFGATLASSNVSSAFASETKGGLDLDWLTDPSKGNDTFKEAQETLQQTGNSAYQLIMTASILGLMVAIALCGFAFFMHKNPNRKQENKEHLIYIALGAALLFGAPSLVGILYSIGTNF